MALEHSYNLIKDLNDQHEVDDYIEGLLKDPEMRADMERAEQPSKWDTLTQGMGAVQPPVALESCPALMASYIDPNR